VVSSVTLIKTLYTCHYLILHICVAIILEMVKNSIVQQAISEIFSFFHLISAPTNAYMYIYILH